MGDIPETRFAKTDDGAHIAFQVLGDGPPDLVFMAEGSSNVEFGWEIPAYDRGFRRLASLGRLIRFDTRGEGLSDPLGLSDQLSLEGQAKDMLTVLDAAGAERPAVVAHSGSGLLAIFFAASYPNRISSLVLDGCWARLARAPDYPWGIPQEVLEQAIAGHDGGSGAVELGLVYVAPSAMKDPAFVAQWNRRVRSTSFGPAGRNNMAEMMAFSDVRPLLTAVQAPTLVLYRRGDRFAGKPHAAYLAQHIAGAKFVELPGEDNMIFVGDSDANLDEIGEFLTGTRHAPRADRVLATVLFTDIAGSTERAAELGDRRWRDLLDALKAKPSRSNRQTAKMVGADHKTAASVRDQLEATGEIPQLEATVGADKKARPSRRTSKPSTTRRATNPRPSVGPSGPHLHEYFATWAADWKKKKGRAPTRENELHQLSLLITTRYPDFAIFNAKTGKCVGVEPSTPTSPEVEAKVLQYVARGRGECQVMPDESLDRSESKAMLQRLQDAGEVGLARDDLVAHVALHIDAGPAFRAGTGKSMDVRVQNGQRKLADELIDEMVRRKHVESLPGEFVREPFDRLYNLKRGV